MDINNILKDLYEKRKSYKVNKPTGNVSPVMNFDFASLYPTTMIFNEDEQKRIKREKKLKRILGETEE